MKDRQRTIRLFYKKMIRLYPNEFRAELGESMEQTFRDLCDENQRRSGQGWIGFVLWIFVETAVGILKEWVESIRQNFGIRKRKGIMEIRYASVLVDDQDKALQFYTEKLGFVKKEMDGWAVEMVDGCIQGWLREFTTGAAGDEFPVSQGISKRTV